LGLWAVGSLLGKTMDVDLATLRRKGIVRIQVAMMDSKVLQRLVQDSNVFVKSDVLVKLRVLTFVFAGSLMILSMMLISSHLFR
jgi:hypothetical protein